MRKTKAKENDFYEKDIDSDVESINCCQLNVHKAKIRETRSKYHNHPEKNFIYHRSCTDVVCLLIFIGCLTAWMYLGYFAITSTPLEGILAPTDSKNRRCGYDDGVEDKPNVFYFDLRKCMPPKANVLHCNTPRVCVSECPKENFYLKVFLDSSNINVIKNKLICQDGFNKANIYNRDTALRAVQNNFCAEWYLESTAIGNRCLPKSLKSTTEELKIGFQSLGRHIESTINGITGKELFDASKAMTDIYEFGHAVFEDLTRVWPWILVHVCVAAVICFIYITIMRWLSGVMVWLSIFTSIALLLFSSYYTWDKFQEIAKEERQAPPTDVRNSLLGLLWNKYTWLTFFILSIAFLAVILLTIIFLRRRISLAVELITEGSKAVTSSWSAVIFPVFPWVIQIACVAYAVIIFAYLLNSGVPVNKVVGLNSTTDCICRNGYQEGSVCDVQTFNNQCRMIHTNAPCTTAGCFYSDNETQQKSIYLQLYNLLMFLWSLFFASGFGQMVLASTFATYYWTFNKNDLPIFMVAGGVWRVMRYHLGTISLGSFLLALCNWIRILIEMWYNYLNKYDNSFVKFVRCCCACFFWVLNSFLKFLNKNAYIMCAVHGKNFCTSARLAFDLLLRNVLRVAILDRVTNFLFFLGKVMVTTALGVLSFHFFSNPVPSITDPFKGSKYTMEYYFVPMVIICIVTYFIASLFFGVYSMAVDTIFLCALEDLETNDGSPEKPYFMSKNLMKILKKKNQIKVK